MTAAQKLDTLHKGRSTRTAIFNASIDKGEPLNFRATFSQVIYPQWGEPPRWTINANYRDPMDNQIKTIRVILFKDPVDSKAKLANADVMVTYSDSAEEPPSEYSTNDPTTAFTFDSENSSIKGEISATVSDGLEPGKTHELTLEFDLQAAKWSQRR
ncbi:hypothetical protein [Pseudomonas moraviensis]|uniref:Uncharacterized protein n=1 Tax=Pseudomonas moraviensis TaxID=321662 RepID=A0A7Y9W051_9PSED|nr:hypothetical protein [Pseudomonas moraviensis]NYH11729.1 hypothetical protein [Pseudomonas moraviensis]